MSLEPGVNGADTYTGESHDSFQLEDVGVLRCRRRRRVHSEVGKSSGHGNGSHG